MLNFPTKKHWRSPSQLSWIEAGLVRFLETYSQYGITSVSFPQLGTGNGGLDWAHVRPLMEKHLGQARIPVYIHVRPRDPKFVPEHLRPGDVFELSRELHTARKHVTFEQFVLDLQNLLGGRAVPSPDASELPSLEVAVQSGVRVIPGEQLLDFWQALRLQGALKLTALPASFRDVSLALPEKPVTLDYIKSMEFGADRISGLRYAPSSLSVTPTSIDVHPE